MRKPCLLDPEELRAAGEADRLEGEFKIAFGFGPVLWTWSLLLLALVSDGELVRVTPRKGMIGLHAIDAYLRKWAAIGGLRIESSGKDAWRATAPDSRS